MNMNTVKGILIFLFCLTTSIASAQEITDSRRVAQAFGEIEIRSFEGYFFFNRRASNVNDSQEAGERVSGIFKMVDGLITYLQINNETIIDENDEPLYGLPSNNEGGVENYRLNIHGRDLTGTTTVAGKFETDILYPGQPITINLSNIFTKIEVDLGYEPELEDAKYLRILNDENLGVGGYDDHNSVFYIYTHEFNVYNKKLNYRIVDIRTMAVHKFGTIDIFNNQDEEEYPRQNIINIGLPSGVVKIDPPNEDGGFIELNDQHLDGGIRDDNGDNVPAKVYILKNRNREGNFCIYGSDGYMEIQEWTPVGKMESLYSSELEKTRMNCVELSRNLGTVVVIITEGDVAEKGFWLKYSRN